MKNVNQNQNSQKAIPKTSRKQDTNLRKNSTLYFQIGLILCLLASYTALEYNFEAKTYAVVQPSTLDDPDVTFITPVTVIERDAPKSQPNKTKVVLIEPKIVENETPDPKEAKEIVDAVIDVVPTDTKLKVIDEGDLDIDEVDETPPIPATLVENVPVYPGCESATNNTMRLKCMSEKLSKLVQKKFDTDVAMDNGLSGRQRIHVQFKITKSGEVQFVASRAPHKSLEKEAERLTNTIPTMKPGIQNGRAVDVLYTLPILFDVQD